MKYKITLLILFTFYLNHNTRSQDIPFSMYNYTPTLINPALVATSSQAQVIFNYRSQWKSLDQKFNTPLLTAIYPFVNKNNVRKGGIGLSVLSDKAGSEASYQNTGALLSLAYNMILSKKSQLSFGLGGGYFQKRLSDNNLSTGSQYVPGVGYNSSLSLGESTNSYSVGYFDMNAGVMLYGYDNINTRKKYYLGVSGFHLNMPNQSVSGERDRLPVKLVTTAGYLVYNRPDFTVTPEVLYMRNSSAQRLLGGVQFKYYFSDPSNRLTKDMSIGFTPRYGLNDAWIFAVELNKKLFTFGFSYDVNTSPLSQFSNYRGATEIMVSYKFPVKRKQKVTEDYSVGQVKDIFIYRDRNIETEESDKTKGYVFHLKEGVYFEFNDTTLSEKSKAQLTDIANLMKGNKNLKVKVLGHSDNLGTKKKNQEISEQRAQVAADYLMKLGIAKNKITIKGKGDNEPLKSNDTEEGRAINRRVEFEIYK